MASIAIPILFPAVRIDYGIGYDYFGDGSMRQLAPLSAALHLGADRLLVVGTRNDDKNDFPKPRFSHPSVGEISGYILDMVFMDSLSMDIERLKRINHTLEQIPSANRDRIALRPIELRTVFPSQDIRPITERYRGAFPRSVRYLLRCPGALNQGDGRL